MAHEEAKQQVRIALLGAGGRGRGVLGNWVRIGGCKVTAVIDPSQGSLDLARAKLGADGIETEFTTDVRGWLARADCDLVSINSWDPQHAQNAIDCFDAGLNIIVAKPMTQTTEDADRVYAAWRRSGKIGLVDMQLRATGLVKKAMEIINSGALGQVRLITCMDSVGRGGVEFRHSRSRRRDMIHSWTLAKGVHFLDLINLFAGADPTRVYATGGRSVFGGDKPNDLTCDKCDERQTCQYNGIHTTIGGQPFPKADAGCVFTQETSVNDHVTAMIQYANGVRASYTECYFTPEYQSTYDIIGDKGALFVRYSMDNRLYLQYRPRAGATVTTIPIHTSGAHGGGDAQLVMDAVEAVLANRQIEPSIRSGRQAVALCEAIDKSIDTGREMAIAPLPELDEAAVGTVSQAL